MGCDTMMRGGVLAPRPRHILYPKFGKAVDFRSLFRWRGPPTPLSPQPIPSFRPLVPQRFANNHGCAFPFAFALPPLLQESPDNHAPPSPSSHMAANLEDHRSRNVPTSGTTIDATALTMVAKAAISVIIGVVLSFWSRPALASLHASLNGNTAVGSKTMLGGVGLVTSAWTGFAAGCLHTLTGPDHLAALAPLSIGRTKMESLAVGALWGCGHDAGQVLFGLLFLLLKEKMRIEVIRAWGARVVGMTLVAIGALGIKEANEMAVPCIAGQPEISHSSEPFNKGGKTKLGFATFATGIIHGLQPDALLMILPALSLPSRLAGASFLIMFLVGTVVAMGSYTTFIGSCSQALQARLPRVNETLSWGSSLVAIFVGLGILMGELFGASLF